MILRREESGFAGTVEFVFRHAILRDVTYETLVPRQRRAYHKQVADWLLAMGGERASELTLLVASHYERAGEPGLAADQLRRAGEAATLVGAYEEAMTNLIRALEMVADPKYRRARFAVHLAIMEIQGHTGQYEEARRLVEPTLEEVRADGDRALLAKTLGH